MFYACNNGSGSAINDQKGNMSVKSKEMMQINFEPGPVHAGREVVLGMSPVAPDSGTFDLEVQHEKKIHLILVSDDLSWFSHIHPEPDGHGNYTVKTIFPFGGRFHAFADFKPVGGKAVVEKTELNVEGKTETPAIFNVPKLTGSSGSYSLELKPAGAALRAESDNHLVGILKKDGVVVDVNTLSNYLGAKAHVVVVGQQEITFIHAHPHVMGKELGMHIAFDKPGIFRAWVQFNADDTLHTIDLTLQVVEGEAHVAEAGNPHEMHH
ncbi:hypothetical protein OI18_18260 [Flavihumibacter solisilvae]|uniref:Uncharacterized protein n=1 Tax=Flavihumibacter solisilvae TaxID=1349421 RepID=A0A0C1IG95_9BACT|nr:hypothetical protein OI18_18260 [Flavihumibacter solisilvae]